MFCEVYIFEYVINVGLGSKADTNRSKDFQDNTYEIFQVCYQVGVFISRSSVAFVDYFHFEIITIIQALNCVLWHFQVYIQFLPMWFQYSHMVTVGLLGGAM